MSMKTSMDHTVLLVGDVMVDVLVKPEGALRKGSDRRAQIELKPGGSAANQATWLAANNVSCKLVARVGAADLDNLQAQFSAKGVHPQFIADVDRTTGVLVSMISSDGERSFYTDRGANEGLCIDDLAHDLLDGVKSILLSGYSFFVAEPRAVAREIMGRAKARNIPVMIDPSSAGFILDVGVKSFLKWTSGAAVLFPNAEEAELLSGEQQPERQLAVLGQYYEQVVLTQGAAGASAVGADGSFVHVDSPNAEVVDTTGAGDAFVGGFLAAKQTGHSLEVCLAKGAAQGALAVGKIGAQPA